MSDPYPENAQKNRRFCVLCLGLDMLAHLGKSSRKVAWAGVLLAPTAWLADAGIDFYFFGEGESFGSAFWRPDPVELWMRLLVSFLFVAFGIYAAFLLDRAERVERELRVSNEQLENLKAELEQLVVVDPLTGAFNRRKFHESIGTAIAQATRHEHLFALLVLDIDNFKQINDRYGHQAGDGVLREVCELVASSVRGTDQMFRVGGEEFCLVAMAMDAGQAGTLAEKIRHVVESHRFGQVGQVTISIGIAHFREGDTQHDIYGRADAALYEAKRRGRNRVVSSSSSERLSFEVPG